MSGQEMQSAVAIIKDEHRSFAAVIKAMEHLLKQSRAAGATPDFRLLRACIYYIETFTEALHHPKEEAYLFRLLRSRTHEFDRDLARLEREHIEEAQTYYELARALRRYQNSAEEVQAAAFAHVLARFAEGAWEHMRFEEQVILPAAARHLSPEDWKEVSEAFFTNADPRFGAEPDEQFHRLFAEIQSLMPEGMADE